MSGWIKIHRIMLQWEHFNEPSVVTVFLALLLSADRDGKTDINLCGLMSLTRLSHNTISQAIAKLVKSGEIARTKQGQKIFTTITNWSEYQENSLTQKMGECENSLTQKMGECENSLTQKMGECENSLTQNLKVNNPKNGSIIHPKNGSIIYNKNNNKNIVVAETHAHTHEEFVENALTDLAVERGCMAMRITPEEYRQLVTEVTNDWIYRQLPDNEWTLTHLLAQMRIKNNINNRNNGTNKIPGQQNDPIDKLNRDAVKAMAALAAEIGKPQDVPF